MTVTIEKQTHRTCFQLKSSRVTCMTMELQSFDEQLLTKQIEHLISQAPHCLKNAPVILSLDKYIGTLTSRDIGDLRRVCGRYSICLFAFRGGDTSVKNAAIRAGLIPLPSEKATKCDKENELKSQQSKKLTAQQKKIKPHEEPSSEKRHKQNGSNLTEEHINSKEINFDKSIAPISSQLVPTTSAPPTQKHEITRDYQTTFSRIIKEPVRSGQQIYHRGELIILAPVSAGAELVSEGSIHVYGTLRGKALAGVNGNNQARIFCSCFESELISINGHYKTANDILPTQMGRSVQIWFHDGRLNITPLPTR